MSSIRCTSTSVSVSLWNTCPRWCEFFLDGRVILDDPVVDQREIATGALVRVRIHIIGRPVGGPAGVADPQRCRFGGATVDVRLQVAHLALAL
jgi:hypothetical protein